jgi:NAD(P)-dependent dehydrogenase (short-subunit alcohol dehydrogenase family)
MAGWFEGKSVIVTGAGSGIGRASALRFAEEGARVCVADVDAARAEAVSGEIVQRSGAAFAIAVDVASEADNERLGEAAVARHGGIDVAFLNAGVGGTPMDALEGDLAMLDRVLAVNLRGCLLGVRSVAQRMRRGGAIVVTGSVGSVTGIGFNPVYAASKHAVLGLVRSLAGTLAARGIRINAVCPGGVATAMTGQILPDLAVGADALPMTQFRARAHPQTIAEAVLFLASARAANVTGTAFVADAGQTAGLEAPARNAAAVS